MRFILATLAAVALCISVGVRAVWADTQFIACGSAYLTCVPTAPEESARLSRGDAGAQPAPSGPARPPRTAQPAVPTGGTGGGESRGGR